MPGILPEQETGGLVYRDAAGIPLNVPGVFNAYSPSQAFISTCELTALPSDCTARIEPRQINAIVSELLSFAECLDPNGPWDCNSLRNLCSSFTAWAAVSLTVVVSGDTPPANPPTNQMWFESDTGMLFLYYDDGNTKQWVQVVGSAPVMDGKSIVGIGSVNDPYRVGLIDCGEW
jgi:hypothetical protein